MRISRALVLAAVLAASAQDNQSFTVSLAAAGATNAYGIQAGAVNHTLQTVWTATPSACAIQLEGSLDGANWANLSGSQSCLSSPTMFHVDGKAVNYVRANLTSYTSAGSLTVSYRGSK